MPRSHVNLTEKRENMSQNIETGPHSYKRHASLIKQPVHLPDRSGRARRGAVNALKVDSKRECCDVSGVRWEDRKSKDLRFDTVGPRVLPRVNRQGFAWTRYCRPITCPTGVLSSIHKFTRNSHGGRDETLVKK